MNSHFTHLILGQNGEVMRNAFPIAPSRKSHNASHKYPTMHHCIAEMCMCAHFCNKMSHNVPYCHKNFHISVTNWYIMIWHWCIVGFAWHVCDDIMLCSNWKWDFRNMLGPEQMAAILLKFINTLRPRPDGSHFPDDIFKCIFLNENV